jgi:hypothetical protein
MISNNLASLLDRDVALLQAPPKASVDRLLSLAAAPTFAIMALLTIVFDGNAPGILCSTMHHGPALGGMASMYVLMSAFHSRPWLTLLSRRRSGPPQC